MTSRVNKGRVGLLVAALRSGLYVQGIGKLHHIGREPVSGKQTDTWCCLGVATDVARRFGVEMSTEVSCSSEYFDGAVSVMPAVAANWYGLDANPQLALKNGDAHSAMNVNDLPNSFGNESTFEGIAQAFERTYLQPEEAATA